MRGRPIYESQHDRDNEAIVQKQVEAWARCSLTKQPYNRYLDWEAHRDNTLVALMEFKQRKNPRLQYPTYMVAHTKWMNGLRMSGDAGVPFILFVKWTDGLFYLHVREDTPITVASGGRWDRGDKADVEQMAYVNTSLFKPIPT